jgi:zinc protease
MRSFFALSFAALLTWTLFSFSAFAQASKDLPQIVTHTLANGLEVVVIPDRRAPVVTHMVWYKVGAADEQRGKSGIAHFLARSLKSAARKTPSLPTTTRPTTRRSAPRRCPW